MQAGHRGLRPRRALIALVVLGCAALLGVGSPAHATGGATTTLSNDVVHNLEPRDADRAGSGDADGDGRRLPVEPEPGCRGRVRQAALRPVEPELRQLPRPRPRSTRSSACPRRRFQATESWLQADGLTVDADRRRDGLRARQRHAQRRSQRRSARRSTTTRRPAGAFYANTAAPSVPASLGVSDVLGLNDFNRFYIPRVQATGTPTTTATVPSGQHSEDRAPQPQGPLVDLRPALDEPAATARRWRSSAGASPTGDPRPAQLRGRVGLPGRADHGEELRRHLDARHERRRRDRRVGARHAGVDRHGAGRQVARRSTSRITTPTPTSSPRSPAG